MRTSQISLSIRTSQMLVRHSQKSTLLLYLPVCTSERSVHISDLSLSPSKLEDHQFALLKTSTEQFFSIALHTSDISTALFWSTTLRTHFREKLKINGINPIHYGGRRRGGRGGEHIVRAADSFVCCGVVGVPGILRKWNFQRIPKPFEGFCINFFFLNFVFRV